MPCVVPNCDPKGQCFALHFPQSYLLCQRWKQAIELGSGVPLPEDVDPLEAKICQQHFNEFDEYGEPVIFWNESQDREIRLSCCRLCLNFAFPMETVSNWKDLTLGEHTIDQLLKSVLRIDCNGSDYFDCRICQECLVRLDLLATIYGQFSNGSKAWKKLKGLSKHERRVWDKISIEECSTHKEDSLANVQPMSSEAILWQVEMNEEETIKNETESVEHLGPENEERDSFYPEEIEKHHKKEGQQLSETPESVNCGLEEKIEQLGQHIKPNKRGRPPKCQESDACSEKRKKSYDTNGLPSTENAKNKKRGRPPAQPKLYLRKLNNRKCYICIKEFDSPDELLDHLLNHCDEDLICGDCSERFSSLTVYNRHLAKHDSKERPFKCTHCTFRYKNNRGLLIHEELVHHIDHGGMSKVNRRHKSFTCQYCGKVFKFLIQLQSHEDAHTGNKPHKCKHCNKAFRLRANLERHYMVMHTSLKPFKCDICGSIFKQFTSYEEHCKSCNPEAVREIIASGETSNTCRFCSTDFEQHSELVGHIDRDHSNEELLFLRCNICKERFVEKYDHAIHMQKHSKAKRHFQCRHCPKLCKSEMHLKGHELSHEGIRIFFCQQCSKTFTQLANLIRHERIHTGVKPHQCDVCSKKFVEVAQLRIHSRIHTGEKPFECKQCGKRFSDQSTLYRHRKNVCNTT